MAYDEGKFVEFNHMIDDACMNRIDMVMVAWPEVLGDTYEELIENLSRIAEKGLELKIVRRKAV